MYKSILSTIILSVMFTGTVLAQTAPNFTITDTKGIQHNLYEDYLDQGVYVVIKVMFVACPPCNAIAPGVQQLYVQWGEGMYDVQFVEMSNKSNDSNNDVQGYQNNHGITFPGAGADGGALAALAPYLQGDFGSFFGTPKFFIVKPDRTVVNVGGSGTQGKLDALDLALIEAGATGEEEEEVLPSAYNIFVSDLFNNNIEDFEVMIGSEDDPNVSYPVSLDATNIFSILDLADEYPGLTSPTIKIRKTDDVADKLSAVDILFILKHIIGISIITDDFLKIAADANSDGELSAIDLFTLQRIILGIDSALPASDPYIFVPSEFPLIIDPGNTQSIQFNAIKIGDMNGF